MSLKPLLGEKFYTTTVISALENNNSFRAENKQIRGDMFGIIQMRFFFFAFTILKSCYQSSFKLEAPAATYPYPGLIQCQYSIDLYSLQVLFSICECILQYAFKKLVI